MTDVAPAVGTLGSSSKTTPPQSNGPVTPVTSSAASAAGPRTVSFNRDVHVKRIGLSKFCILLRLFVPFLFEF